MQDARASFQDHVFSIIYWQVVRDVDPHERDVLYLTVLSQVTSADSALSRGESWPDTDIDLHIRFLEISISVRHCAGADLFW
jgi:hypothetical protein